jgi:hypothetical protein
MESFFCSCRDKLNKFVYQATIHLDCGSNGSAMAPLPFVPKTGKEGKRCNQVAVFGNRSIEISSEGKSKFLILPDRIIGIHDQSPGRIDRVTGKNAPVNGFNAAVEFRLRP